MTVRQPWIAYRQMRVEDAVTTSNGVWLSLAIVVVVYTAMLAGAALVLRSMSRRWREGESLDLPTPYDPSGPTVSERPEAAGTR